MSDRVIISVPLLPSRTWKASLSGKVIGPPGEFPHIYRLYLGSLNNLSRKTGQPLLIDGVRYHVPVTNLPATITPRRAFELYRACGAAGEANKELKHDLDLKQLPSQSCNVNEVFLNLGTMAYNLLTRLGQQWHDSGEDVDPATGRWPVRRRIKTIQDYLLRSAARHENRVSISRQGGAQPAIPATNRVANSKNGPENYRQGCPCIRFADWG